MPEPFEDAEPQLDANTTNAGAGRADDLLDLPLAGRAAEER
jgi:hypothetical protein